MMDSNTQDTLEKFASVIRELTDTAENIAHIEEQKAAAASEKRHQLMDTFIQDEQAQILKLRGLEQRRLRLADSLGWKSLTFRQILEKAEPQQQTLLEPLFLNLERQLKRLEQARGNAEQIIHTRLHEIEILLARQQGSSYDNTGNVNLSSPVHTKLQNKYV